MRRAGFIAVIAATTAAAQPPPVDKKAPKIDPPIASAVTAPPRTSGTRLDPPAPNPKPPRDKHPP